ncbi:MAG: hypothetical protein MHM6MM_002619 [Cercozoa sp. M6MM]
MPLYKYKLGVETCIPTLAKAFVKGWPHRMLRVQTSIEHSDDITNYALRALRRVATENVAELKHAISNALVYLLWCEAKLYDPLSDACEPDFVHCLEEFDLQFEFSLSPKLKSTTCWEFFEESPCSNKLAAFVRKRVRCAIEMVQRRGGTVPLHEWLPYVLVKPSLNMETPDYSDLFGDMNAVLLSQGTRIRMDYTKMLERINARGDSVAFRNTSLFARLLVTHEVVQHFDFGAYVSGRCARRLSLGGSIVDVMRMHTGVTSIQEVLTSVRSQPLSEWAHLLPFLEEGKGRIHAALASLPEMAKSFISQCADASADDVDRAMQVLQMLRGVELKSVKLWSLSESCEFRYSSQLRESLHGLAQVIGTISHAMTHQGAQQAWEPTLQVNAFRLQRLLLQKHRRRERVVVSSHSIQEVHALLWMFVLSGITEVNKRPRGNTRETAERALLLDMLLQLVQQVVTRAEQDSRALLLSMCDDTFGDTVVPVEIANLIYSFVGDSRDNGLFAASAAQLMGSQFLSELVSHAVCCLLQVAFKADLCPTQQMPARLDLDIPTDSLRVVPIGGDPHESLLIQIEQDLAESEDLQTSS